MTSSPVLYLFPFAVPPDKLRYPEYCFQVAVDFSKKLKDEPGVGFLKQILTGLLNTSGGIIEIWSYDNKPPDPDILDKWKRNLEDSLKAFIPYKVIQSCIRLLDDLCSVRMIVIKSPDLITLSTNLYVRGFAGNRMVDNSDHINDVITQASGTPFPDPFFGQLALTYGDTLNVNEGLNVEFKCWKVDQFEDNEPQKVTKSKTLRFRLEENRTQHSLFSLPNMSEGGYLIMGIEEDNKSKTNKVRGQITSDADKLKLEGWMTDFMQTDVDGSRRYWCNGSSDHSPRPGDWSIRFIPVTGGPPGESLPPGTDRSVIVIHFKHSPGGVFMKCPESYLVSEDGFIVQMSESQWLETVTSTTKHVSASIQRQTITIATQTIQGKPITMATQTIQEESITMATDTTERSPISMASSAITTTHPPSTHRKHSAKERSLAETSPTVADPAPSRSTTPPSTRRKRAVEKISVTKTDTTKADPAPLTSTACSPSPCRKRAVEEMSVAKTSPTTADPAPSTSTARPLSPGRKRAVEERSVAKTSTITADPAPSTSTARPPSPGRKRAVDEDVCGVEEGHSKRLKSESTESVQIDGNIVQETEPTKNLDKAGSDIFLGRDVVTWTEHKQNWASNLETSTIDLEENAHKFASSSALFKLSNPMTLTPELYTITEVHQGMDRVIAHINTHINTRTNRKSFGLAASQWTLNIWTETAPTRPTDHRLDIFVVDETGRIELWAVVDEAETDHRNTWEYVLVSGRLTKRNMLYNRSHRTITTAKYVWVNCHIYRLNVGEIPSTSKPEYKSIVDLFNPPSTSQANLDDLRLRLARVLLQRDTRLKSILGDELSVVLTAEQMETILSLGLDRFSYIEGPPGSGKTYLALHFCQKYTNYGFIVTTPTFRKFLIYQGLAEERLFVASTSEDLLGLCTSHDGRAPLDGFDNLILDDVQNTDFPEKTWQTLFRYIKQTDKKLIVFGDSVYQQFQPSQVSVREVMQGFCTQGNHHMTQKALTVIHRNTRKVASFIKSSASDTSDFPDHRAISCSRPEDGDDVEVKYLRNMFGEDRGGLNLSTLVPFLRSLIVPQQAVDNDKAAHEPKDVALLVDRDLGEIWATDSDDSAADVNISNNEHESELKYFRRFIKDKLDKEIDVHDAGTFPVTGLTVDTLDNFMGMDCRVCVLIAGEDVMGMEQQTGRSINNPRYKTFVASRGISKVIFLVDSPLTADLGSKFHFDNLPKGARPLWHHAAADRIRDLCYIDTDGHPAVVFVTDRDSRIHAVSMAGERRIHAVSMAGERRIHAVSMAGEQRIHAVSMAGEPLPVSFNPAIVDPWYIASSGDGRRVVVAGRDTKHAKLSYYWSVYTVQTGGRLERDRTYELPDRPQSVSWSPDGNVIFVLDIEFEGRAVKMSPKDGHELWRSDPHQYLVRVAVRGDGVIYVTDPMAGCIREVSADGQHTKDITTKPDISDPWALCTDSTGRSLFVCDEGSRDIYLLQPDNKRCDKVLEAPGDVRRMVLLEDRYLGAATYEGLVGYDVSGVL